MQYKKLGRTGLMVSEICLGTMNFGQQVGESEAISLTKSALAAGINFIDVADLYVNGRAEEITGKALKEDRHSVVLTTKVGSWRSGPGINDIGLSRKHIMKAIEDSLRRLGTDYVDIYFAHVPDYNTPIDETLRAMDDLVHQGKVRYIACSNFRAWQLCDALWVSNVYNLARFNCIQSPYSLIARDIEYELLPLCTDKGVGVTIYNPLAGGLLTGKHKLTKPPTEGRFTLERLGPIYTKRYWSAPNFEAVAQLKKIAQDHGRSLPQFSLAWILNNEAITSIVLGTSSIKQLEENLGATEIKLSEEEITACNDVWQQFRPIGFPYGR